MTRRWHLRSDVSVSPNFSSAWQKARQWKNELFPGIFWERRILSGRGELLKELFASLVGVYEPRFDMDHLLAGDAEMKMAWFYDVCLDGYDRYFVDTLSGYLFKGVWFFNGDRGVGALVEILSERIGGIRPVFV